MNIETMHDEYARLLRVVGNEKMSTSTACAVQEALRRATDMYNANSEEGFWPASAAVYAILNADRLLGIIKRKTKQGVTDEKDRMKLAFEEYFERAPFDEGGPHASNTQDPSDIVHSAYKAAMNETVATRFCSLALAAWNALNSARQIQRMPPKP